jgi:hypothetical protein
MVLDGDGFILQVHGVFTRIRSGATPVALGGGALRSCSGGGVRWRRFLVRICLKWLRLRGVKNPKGFGFYL